MDQSGRCACGCTEQVDGTATFAVVLQRCGVVAEVTAPARRCAACGAPVPDPAASRLAQLAVGRQLADLGVRTGDALRHMRKALGLRACDLARLLGVTPETISHWERGHAETPCAVFAAVGAMVEEALSGRTATWDRLARLADGRPFPRALALTVPAKAG